MYAVKNELTETLKNNITNQKDQIQNGRNHLYSKNAER